MKAISEARKREILEYAKANTAVKAGKKYKVHPVSIYKWRSEGKRGAAKKFLKARLPKGGTVTETPHWTAVVGATEAQVEDAVRWALFGYKEAMAKK